MLRSLARHWCDGLLFVCSLSLIAFSLFIACFGLAAHVIRRRFRGHQRSGDADLQRRWPVDEFQFEGAIAVYEDLIDANSRRRQ